MPRVVKPPFDRSFGEMLPVPVIISVDILTDCGKRDVLAFEAFRGTNAVGTQMRKIVAHRHVQAMTSRHHRGPGRYLERFEAGADTLGVHPVQDCGFLIGQPGRLLGRWRFGRKDIDAQDRDAHQGEHQQPHSSLDRTAAPDHSGSGHMNNLGRTPIVPRRSAASSRSSAHCGTRECCLSYQPARVVNLPTARALRSLYGLCYREKMSLSTRIRLASAIFIGLLVFFLAHARAYAGASRK